MVTRKNMFNRRQFLKAMGVTGLTLGLNSCQHWMARRLTSPCISYLPDTLANHEVIKAGWDGLDSRRVWDCHAHLAGVGDNGSGIWVNPAMNSPLNPVQSTLKQFYLSAGCSDQSPGQIDHNYVTRLKKLADGMTPGFKMLLFAFDRCHDENGEVDWKRTTFYIPDAYARDVALSSPERFGWVASIHPYRLDAITSLETAAKTGAVAVKWIPSAMNIDPASGRCDQFYELLARYNLPLITHAGRELAVPGGTEGAYNNPLRLRRALDHGVRVVVAHCASSGRDYDIDRGSEGPTLSSFSLFERLMNDHRYDKNLFGDISALIQPNRAGVLKAILERTEWHDRLLNGSDYPLPAVAPRISIELLAQRGLLSPSAVPVLKDISDYNPLLFDFQIKRHLAYGDKRFSHTIFETSSFFDRKSITGEA